jgi:branched-chain amino acid transport system permease protein
MTLIFGVMRIVNIAHGTLYLVGGYVGYVVARQTGNFYLAVVVACITVAVIGMFVERFLLRELQGQMLRQMLMTMGITLFMQDTLLLIFEGYPFTIDPPAWTQGTINIGNYYFYNLRLFMIGAAVLTYIILWWLQEKTRAGAIMRATVDNREMSQGIGINVNIVSMGVFGLGALLAAFAGVIGGSFTAVYPGL